jgi:hypothetical protein
MSLWNYYRWQLVGIQCLVSMFVFHSPWTTMTSEVMMIIYHPSVYTEPCLDWGTWNSLSRQEPLQISNLQAPSLSAFRTIKSFEPEGDGTITETPDTSTGNGAHCNVTEPSSLRLVTVDDRINFRLLFARRFGWLTENINPCEEESITAKTTWIKNRKSKIENWKWN